MKASFLTLALALVVSVAGCATTTGRPFDQAAASHFVDGKTTQAEVRSALVEPETVQDRGDGSSMWIYSSSKSGSDWRTYVPFAALGAHGSSEMQALSLVFDRRGVLQSHTAMQSR
ncbi:hypothetical protein [Luteibacter sahnii]|uniref:hypothetical protein n=1 Tax=Luteibacter sahnii TaxID=3021977 RepID=UPI002A6B4186|nr:hypothetical protein [Luteibacter sp. PPL193]MDY1548541.1 hypothetical protein [Luteibacter sp. PPL193]